MAEAERLDRHHGPDRAGEVAASVGGFAVMQGRARIPCPFVDADGRCCSGQIERIEAFRADLLWADDGNSRRRFGFRPRSFDHLFGSENGNRASFRRQDPRTVMCWLDHLPEEAWKVTVGTAIAGR